MRKFLDLKKLKLFILIILSGIFLIILSTRTKFFLKDNTIPIISEKFPVQLSELHSHNIKPFYGRVDITPDFSHIPVSRTLNTEDFSPNILKEEFISFRIKRVKRHKELNFFHPDYHPFRFFHKHIYRLIRFNKSYLRPVNYFVANPYQLIIFTRANHVTPLNMELKNFKIEYNKGVIREIYRGEEANRWLRSIFSYTDYPGKVWAIMVNAWDAGFFYIYADVSKSANVLPGENGSVTTSTHSGEYFYHVGRYGVNNLSPSKPDAWIQLKEMTVYTKIYFKIWRRRPESISDKPHLIYQLIIDPKQIK